MYSLYIEGEGWTKDYVQKVSSGYYDFKRSFFFTVKYLFICVVNSGNLHTP